MARRLIIHAGQHKTGTTSIQHYLELHHPALVEMGVFACPAWTGDLTGPDRSVRSRNAGAVAHAVLRSALLTPGRLRGKYPVLPLPVRFAALDRVNAMLKSVPQETVVLSSEAFSFAREDDEFDSLERLCDGLEWSAVMFLREPSSWRDSWLRQIMDAGLHDRPGAVWGEGIFDLRPETWLTDHRAIGRFWRGRCEFIGYEMALAKEGSVFPDFFRAIGLAPERCPEWEGFRRNVTAERLNRRMLRDSALG